jgi:hypothetical protein
MIYTITVDSAMYILVHAGSFEEANRRQYHHDHDSIRSSPSPIDNALLRRRLSSLCILALKRQMVREPWVYLVADVTFPLLAIRMDIAHAV